MGVERDRESFKDSDKANLDLLQDTASRRCLHNRNDGFLSVILRRKMRMVYPFGAYTVLMICNVHA